MLRQRLTKRANAMQRCVLGVWLLLSMPVFAQADGPSVLTLEQALDTARSHQPLLRRARALAEGADAAADMARAPLLPQLNATASYQRTTANFVARPGAVPQSFSGNPVDPDFDTFNFFSASATASQLIYDFGLSRGSYRAARETARAEAASQEVTARSVELSVRTAFFQARAARALLEVARATYANQERHREQTQAFVSVGSRPEIDLAQVRTDVANARVQLIQAENAYEIGKAQLNQAMGVERSTSYEVADETLPPVPEEGASIEALQAVAIEARPELVALERRARAQKLLSRSTKGAYGPSLGVASTISEAGVKLNDMTWNWNAGVTLSWPLLSGGLTHAQTRQTRAGFLGVSAELDALRQQVRLQLEQTRLGVRSARAVVEAAEEALINARERLRLAEGRYEAGVGSAIELGDAQLSLTAAEAQRVRADYDLAVARAQLLNALGRPR